MLADVVSGAAAAISLAALVLAWRTHAAQRQLRERQTQLDGEYRTLGARLADGQAAAATRAELRSRIVDFFDPLDDIRKAGQGSPRNGVVATVLRDPEAADQIVALAARVNPLATQKAAETATWLSRLRDLLERQVAGAAGADADRDSQQIIAAAQEAHNNLVDLLAAISDEEAEASDR